MSIRLAIRGKLFACLLVLSVVVSALCAAFWVTLDHQRTNLESIMSDRVGPLRDLKVLSDVYSADILDSVQRVRTGEMTAEEAAEIVGDAGTMATDSWAEYKKSHDMTEESKLAAEVDQKMLAAAPVIEQLKAVLAEGDQQKLDAFVASDLYPAIDPVTSALTRMIGQQVKIAREKTTAALDESETYRQLMFALASLSILAFAGAFYVVQFQVVRPVGRLSETIAALSERSADEEVPHINQKDEIGEIARAVQFYRDAVVEKERAKAAAEAEIQAHVTGALGEGLSALVAGDLTYSVTADFPPAYENLKTNFNAALDQLRGTIAAVADRVGTVRSTSIEIENASNDLSGRTSRQAASLEETAAAVEELTGTARATSDNVKQVSLGAESAYEAAVQGASVAKEAATAMTKIAGSSREIGNIVSLIDEIAFQTNLLALNAGVEAARAGDAGRGFAVVANEVRSLAQRSASAAKDIKNIVQTSTEQVATGVDLVSRSGAALEAILGEAAKVKELAGEISSSVHQQSIGVQQISAAVASMDASTQQNAAMAEESNAACTSLAREAEELEEAISVFSYGEKAQATQPKREPAPVPSLKGARRLQRIGNTALKADEEDWNGF